MKYCSKLTPCSVVGLTLGPTVPIQLVGCFRLEILEHSTWNPDVARSDSRLFPARNHHVFGTNFRVVDDVVAVR